MTIRAISAADDLSAPAGLHEICFEQAWTQDAMRDLLKVTGTLALYATNGFVMARVAEDEAEILTIAVAPQARCCGLGSALLNRAAQTASSMGARMMFLEVSESNAAAMALYQRSGFREVGRRKSYYGPAEDALILRAELPLFPLGNPEASIRL